MSYVGKRLRIQTFFLQNGCFPLFLLYPCGQSAQENLNEMRNISIPKVDENNK
jgi:hypothetical protein